MINKNLHYLWMNPHVIGPNIFRYKDRQGSETDITILA